MGNRIIMIAFIGLISVLLLTSAHSQEDMVAVDNSVFDNARRSPSIFVHDAHNEEAGIDDCSECHHVYADDGQLVADESSEDQLCSDCHGVEADGRRPGLMKAFHMNCKGCHLKEKTGPVMCGECHKKER
jgi:hypothetical protein